ncbi:MAG TPA: LLM class F420-dependent oxidoreductase [Acidimicrobiales bacterium]
MKLALGLDLYRGASIEVPIDMIRHAESLGYHSVWTAEAYGCDALSPLAYIAAHTTRIKLGTGVAQLAARPPATLAMTGMTIDAMAGGGRVILGIGVSGPQIVEGWYGQPWGKPNARLRDYVTIVRKVLERKEPVSHDGPEIQLPYRGPGSIGQGKALKSILHPHPGIEVWVASGGPANTALAAELCDGWLPMGFGPNGMEIYGDALEKGFARRKDGRPREAFEIFTGCTVQITDDVKSVLDSMRPLTGMYVGGMGSATHNYHREAMARRGFPEAAARIHELWMAGRKQEAIDAVPDEYLEQSALVGSVQRIRDRWRSEFENRGATGVIVRTPQREALELLADLAGTRDTLESSS